MNDFSVFIERVLASEGGYTNDPRDPGGETQWGIAKRSHPNLDIKALTRAQAIEIYRKEYWLDYRLDQLKGPLGFQVFDFGVNHSPHQAVQILQKIVGVTADGVLGDKTFAAISGFPVAVLVLRFVAERGKFYLNSPLYTTYGRGWLTRVMSCQAWAADDLMSLTVPPSTGVKNG